ncbi:MAG: hypothetical protein P1V35_11715 [Planctomycetota bacterium]|nr:hypothetical protein [Planctomycetota bacterium]
MLRSSLIAAVLGTTDVIYNNTANADFYTTGRIGEQTASFDFVDAGRIPSTGSAGTANRSNYNVNTVSIGYCITNNTASAAEVAVSIYGSYNPCTDPADVLNATCSGQFTGTGLPGATAANIALGYATCWLIDFDLSGGGEICILGDGDGVFDADLDFDSFGIGMEFDPGGAGGYVGLGVGEGIGPLMAGDRMWTVQATGEVAASSGAGVVGCATAATGGGGGTYYGPAECCVPTVAGENSSGLDNQDFNWVGDRAATAQLPGCYWFGGYNNTVGCNADGGNMVGPNAAFYAMLSADQTNNCVPTDCGTTGGMVITDFCNPANNNSTGAPAVMTGAAGSGVGSDLHLDVSGGPLPLGDGTRMLGYYLVGNEATPGIPISDGNFCLVGTATASFGRYNVAGTTRFSLSLFDAAGNLENLVGTGGVTGYGFDVPSEVEVAGTPLTTIMSGDTYHFQCWYRDTLSGSGNSNFSSALSVTFP